MKRKMLPLALVGVLYLALLLGALGLQRGRSEPADAGAVLAANQLVEAGNVAAAAQIYEQLIAQGVNDSAVFYNLGNAYYRQGDVGRALLNYQRAAQLAPRDGDIRANLALARSQVQDPFAETAPGPLALLTNVTGAWLTLDEAALLVLGLWFAAGLLLLAGRQLAPGRRRRWARALAALVMLLVLLGGLSLGSRLYTAQARPEGVVVAASVTVSSEPGAEHATGLALPGGTAVNVTEVRGDWAHLATPGAAHEGWVPLAAVETVASGPAALPSLS